MQREIYETVERKDPSKETEREEDLSIETERNKETERRQRTCAEQKLLWGTRNRGEI